MRSENEFFKLIIKMRKEAERRDPTSYGGNVIPMIRLYNSLTESAEIRAYHGALKLMLQDADPGIRSLAVDLCLAFVVFREVPL